MRLLMVLAIVFAGSIAVLAYGVILDRPALVFSPSEWAMLIGLLQLVALAVLALLAGPPREN